MRRATVAWSLLAALGLVAAPVTLPGARGLVGCSSPLTPAVGANDGGDAPTVTLPPGGQCASLRGVPAPSTLADAGIAADAGSGFGPAQPLGVGYPGGGDELPPHVAYLTFDDGPSDWTNDFLDTLKSHAIHATFFVTARQLKGPAGLDGTYVDEYGHEWAYRDLVKRELDEGHVVGNHTVDHPDLAAIVAEQIQSELDENEFLINTALLRAGSTPHVLSLFRPPFGSPWYTGDAVPLDPGDTTTAAQRIANHGLNVMWNIDSSDSLEWAQGESFSRTPGMITPSPGAPTYAAKMMRIETSVLGDDHVKNGDGIVVLMHDTHETTRDVLEVLIDGLQSAGYSFETIEQYAQRRWGRPSIDLTPGPALYTSGIQEENWGCASFGVPVGTDRTREVCGRMWLAYEALGGESTAGQPTAAPTQSADGIPSQSFSNGSIELHPENPPPCNMVFVPRVSQ
jgi:peptidoglycan/xylan/chitin deacetylase (PgdA/CDA1 family)